MSGGSKTKWRGGGESVRSHTFMGTRICIEFKKLYGLVSDGTMTISHHDLVQDELDTLIHEALHVCFPEFSEQRVTNVSVYLSAALWRRGFRRATKRSYRDRLCELNRVLALLMVRRMRRYGLKPVATARASRDIARFLARLGYDKAQYAKRGKKA